MAAERFDLALEMAFDAEAGIADLDRHLSKLKDSADALGFAFDRHLARNELQAATFRGPSGEVRMLLARGGAMAIELRARPGPPAEPVKVAVAQLPLAADDPRLRHRTTNRFALDEAR
ncbi:MAG: aminotransferase class IV, partial [Sphingosinicella sp.]